MANENMEPVVCHHCQQPGHFMRDCPAKANGIKKTAKAAKTVKAAVTCFHCHELGHYKWECPELHCRACDGGHPSSQCIGDKDDLFQMMENLSVDDVYYVLWESAARDPVVAQNIREKYAAYTNVPPGPRASPSAENNSNTGNADPGNVDPGNVDPDNANPGNANTGKGNSNVKNGDVKDGNVANNTDKGEVSGPSGARAGGLKRLAPDADGAEAPSKQKAPEAQEDRKKSAYESSFYVPHNGHHQYSSITRSAPRGDPTPEEIPITKWSCCGKVVGEYDDWCRPDSLAKYRI